MIISCANEKGGSGKTSTTAMIAWELANMGYKTLIIDCDPQANMTDLMIKTKSNDDTYVTIDTSLFGILVNHKNIESGKINIKSNLDLIPVASDMNMFSRWVDKQKITEKEKVTYLKKAIEPIKDKYDFIFLDVSPTMSLTNDNVFMACDFLVIMLQTQQRAFLGAKSFIEYLQTNLINEFNARVDIVGILPVLTKSKSDIDKNVLFDAIEHFGIENMFSEDNYIKAMERVKRYDLTGITVDKSSYWDRDTHNKYKKVALELIERINNIE